MDQLLVEADVAPAEREHLAAAQTRVAARMIGPRAAGLATAMSASTCSRVGASIFSAGLTCPGKAERDVLADEPVLKALLSIARSGARALRTVRLLGVIENMSGDVFGFGGGESLATELDVPLLGSVPLDPLLREQGDAGEPIVASHPESDTAQTIDARREAGSIVKSLPLVS